MPEHARILDKPNKIKNVQNKSRAWTERRKALPTPSAQGSYSLREAAHLLGGLSPRILLALAQKHHISLEIKSNRSRVSIKSLGQLRRLPEVQALRQMAQLDDLGGEMTPEELRELSETRPGPLPWQANHRR